MFTPYLFDPTSQKSIADQVTYNDRLDHAKAHKPRDMKAYMTAEELRLFQQQHTLLPASEKPLDLLHSCCELIIRALMRDEGFNRNMAEAFIKSDLGSEEELLPRFYDLVAGTLTVEQQLLSMSAELHCNLTKTIFVAAMALNQLDYRSFFPERVCVYSPELVLKRINNPEFQPTDAERKQHLIAFREMAFSILNSMSIWEIADLVPMESMQLLQNAGRYNILKEVFANLDAKEEVEAPVPVGLKDELDGEHF